VLAAALSATRPLLGLALVFGVAVVGLRLLDRVPGWLFGPEERAFGSPWELERTERVHLLLPSYFPDSYRWPPRSVRAFATPGAAVLEFASADGGQRRLLLVQTLRGRAQLDRLLPKGVVLERRELVLPQATATLSRVLEEGGAVWRGLRWEQDGELLALYGQGPLEELRAIAASIRRRRP
jgi:hypothetical protein